MGKTKFQSRFSSQPKPFHVEEKKIEEKKKEVSVQVFQDYHYPELGVTIKAKSQKEADQKIKNLQK